MHINNKHKSVQYPAVVLVLNIQNIVYEFDVGVGFEISHSKIAIVYSLYIEFLSTVYNKMIPFKKFYCQKYDKKEFFLVFLLQKYLMGTN